MSDPIRITREDVSSKHVDEVLERERAARAIAARAVVPWYRKFLLSSAFYTAIVGAVGGWLGWMVIEPHFFDIVRIGGGVTEVSTKISPIGCPQCNKLRPIEISDEGKGTCPVCATQLTTGDKPQNIVRGMVKLPQADVFVIPGVTRLDLDGRTGLLESADQIPVAANVAVAGELPEEFGRDDRPILLATRVSVFPAGAPDPDPGPSDLHGIAKGQYWSSTLFAAVVGGLIALLVGAVEGLLSFNFRQMIVGGGIGLGIGFLGGLVGMFPANGLYTVMGLLTEKLSTDAIDQWHGVPFYSQVVARTLAWGVIGMSLALGQGVARGSMKLVVNGLIGGCLGGLFGGLLFDPVAKFVDAEQADLSRAVGCTAVGLFIGLAIGLVEQLSKEAWLLLRSGPLAGKQFVLHKQATTFGSATQCDVFLFKDETVMPEHCRITRLGRAFEIERLNRNAVVTVNGEPVERRTLRDGDQVTIGTTLLEFSARQI